MRKKLFVGVSFVVFMSMTVAWQFATAEIAELQQEEKNTSANQNSEFVFSSNLSHDSNTGIS